ncbi:DUF4292 domain-containing protein [Arcicella aquatica]|uniref:DUF4292 domain-containing protein n=1 Tax=Arcicella aquatica TaxID=217141 RepID=A0ABU5QJ00_9BACT|nr:DUF4292 domain-containing protein [Arcicella aquatica]MEA5257041.1 DUF4292 domain-containing protein [Arcicella aquatica]
MKHYSLMLLAFTFFIASCKRQHINKTSDASSIDSLKVADTKPVIDSLTITTPSKPEVAVTEEEKVKIDEIDFKYLKAKAKVSYKSPNDNQSFTVDIRMRKDSLIWMNVSAFGITVATALFNDSLVKLYDKYHGEYKEYTYEDFAGKFNFNVSYDILQALVVGNRPFKKNKSRVVRSNEYFLLKQEENKVLIDNYIGENKKLKKILLTQEDTSNKLTLDFDDFTTLNQFLFPQSSLITLDYQSKEDQKMYQTVVNIKHTKVELLDTPLEFPFRVPEKLLNKN